MEVIIPKIEQIQMFETYASIIDKEIYLQDSENNKLIYLQSLLLAKMGQ